jgi:hypothetical protein
LGSGLPPAKEIIPARFIIGINSRMGEGFMFKASSENMVSGLKSLTAITPLHSNRAKIP